MNSHRVLENDSLGVHTLLHHPAVILEIALLRLEEPQTGDQVRQKEHCDG